MTLYCSPEGSTTTPSFCAFSFKKAVPSGLLAATRTKLHQINAAQNSRKLRIETRVFLKKNEDEK
jgi:plasmid maintenance system killer protein